MPDPTHPTSSEDPMPTEFESPLAPAGSKMIDCRLYGAITEELIGHFAELNNDFASGIKWVFRGTNMLFDDGSTTKSIERASDLCTALQYLVMMLLGLSDDPDTLRDRVCRHYEESVLPELRSQPFIENVDAEVALMRRFEDEFQRLDDAGIEFDVDEYLASFDLAALLDEERLVQQSLSQLDADLDALLGLNMDGDQ